MKVIALTSKAFSDQVSSRHSSGKNLKDIADVVIDLKCELGDACLSMPNVPDKFSGYVNDTRHAGDGLYNGAGH